MRFKKLFESNDLDDIVKRLKNYQIQYKNEHKPDFVEDIKFILDKIKENDIEKAHEIFMHSDMKYDLKQTYQDLMNLKDEMYIEKNFGKEWGTKKGEYIAYRAGSIRDNYSRGLFFSIDKQGAEGYANENRPVKKYKVSINNPYIAKRLEIAYANLTGKDYDKVIDKKWATKNVSEWWKKLDSQITSIVKRKGYDSILYTNPAPPALKELVIFDPKKAKEI